MLAAILEFHPGSLAQKSSAQNKQLSSIDTFFFLPHLFLILSIQNRLPLTRLLILLNLLTFLHPACSQHSSYQLPGVILQGLRCGGDASPPHPTAGSCRCWKTGRPRVFINPPTSQLSHLQACMFPGWTLRLQGSFALFWKTLSSN